MHGIQGAFNRGGEPATRATAAGPGKFGMMFPGLEPFRPSAESLAALAETMIEGQGGTSSDNDRLPAGFTFLGQFVDHDLTFDPTTLSEAVIDPEALNNYRTPALDLDHLYGRGPEVDPQFYVGRPGREVFALGDTTGSPSLAMDLPRNPYNSRAIIPDPRNDENLIIAQLHVLFLYFHNAVIRALDENRIPGAGSNRPLFEQAREIVRAHYREIVMDEFLPAIVDSQVLEQVRRRGSPIFRGRGVFMPLEFSAAAYPFGHSLISETYETKFRPTVAAVPLGTMFLHAAGAGPAPLVPIPTDSVVDWRRFFDLGTGDPVSSSRTIDPYLARTLGTLPRVDNLALANLRRGAMVGLPSGQDVARYYGQTPLSPDRIRQSGGDGAAAAQYNLHNRTPLWYYILKEAELETGGRTLGYVGSRIVAETFVALQGEAGCSSRSNGAGRITEGPFRMADLVRFAFPEYRQRTPQI
jgi:hypothetical protein